MEKLLVFILSWLIVVTYTIVGCVTLIGAFGFSIWLVKFALRVGTGYRDLAYQPVSKLELWGATSFIFIAILFKGSGVLKQSFDGIKWKNNESK